MTQPENALPPLTAEERAELAGLATRVLDAPPRTYSRGYIADQRSILRLTQHVAVLEADCTHMADLLAAALANCRTLAKLAKDEAEDREDSTANFNALNRRDFYLREAERLKETKL